MAESDRAAPGTVAEGSNRAWKMLVSFLGASLLPLSILAVWQALALLLENALGPFFPTPYQVANALLDWAFAINGSTATFSGTLIYAIGASLRRVSVAFLIAACCGIPLGLLVGWSMRMRLILDPTVQLFRPVPVTAWVPISMLWFGIGDGAAIYLIFLATFFPIYLNTFHGVRYINPTVIRAGQMLGARGLRMIVHVVLPAALPAIFAGLRISVGFAWTAVVVSELVAVKNGLGYVMFDAYGFLRADIVVAAMVVVGVLGSVSDRLLMAAENFYLGRYRGRISA